MLLRQRGVPRTKVKEAAHGIAVIHLRSLSPTVLVPEKKNDPEYHLL